jgi:hypothetical protein
VKLEEKRPFERPKRRLEDNIQMNLEAEAWNGME